MKNEKQITATFAGYGHYKVTTTFYGKLVSKTIDNMPLIDDFKDGKKAARKSLLKIMRREWNNK